VPRFTSGLSSILVALLAAGCGMPASGQVSAPVGQLPLDLRQRDSGFQPVFLSNDSFPAALHSVWRSRAYGFVVDFTGGEPEVFIEAGGLCWRTKLGQDPLFHFYSLSAYRLNGASEAIFTGPPGSTDYFYDRVGALPTQCKQRFSGSPVAVFDAFWNSMNDRYAFFRVRGVSWSQRRNQFRPRALRANGDGELYEILKESIGGFGDGHLTIRAEFGGEQHIYRQVRPEAERLLQALHLEDSGHLDTSKWSAWVQVDQGRIVSDLLPSGVTYGLGRKMFWGMAEHDVGYIAINAMEGYGTGVDEDVSLMASELDRALEGLTPARAIILDVTQNRGGDDRVARVIASRFADKKRLAYTKRADGSAAQPFYIYPAGPQQFHKPVYVLVSELTGSAAEVFALAMHVLPNTCEVGENTGGALSDLLETPLPNGWLLTLSNEIYSDPGGNRPEAVGVAPNRRLQVFLLDDHSASHVNAVRRVIAIAAEGQPCRSGSHVGEN
jgi:carboxyl-terminal processing protease